MASFTTSDFLSGLKLFFITKKLVRRQHEILMDKIHMFGGTVSDHVNENTTHVLFPRGVDYKSGLDSLKLDALPDSVSAVGIDWLPDCIAARKLVPTAQFEVRHCPEAKSQKSAQEDQEERNSAEPSNSKDAHLQRRSIRFNVSGTSKFRAAKDVVGLKQKEVSVRRTLAYGTKYGCGIFCMLKSGEEQIGWVPEKDEKLFKELGTVCKKTNFRAVIETANCKLVGDKFSKINIVITCKF